MRQGEILVQTTQQMEFVDVTERLAKEIIAAGIADGICYLFNPHTTAGVTINEGADPAVRRDLVAVLREIVPFSFPYKHLEGNSPAHLMTSLVGSSATVFITNGRLDLGTWQKIFFCEFDGPRNRKLRWRLV